MAAIQFAPLYLYQIEHLESVLDYVDTDERWVKFEKCVSHLFSHLPRNKSTFIEHIKKGGSPYFYHILSKLKETKDLAFLANCPRAYPSLFRHVYFAVENGEPTILGKGAIWFQDKSVTLQAAKKYAPSVDYVESQQTCVVLSVENCHLHYPEMSHPCQSDALDTFPTRCDSFEKVCLANKTIIQMPWTVNYTHPQTLPLYTYCIQTQNSDVWFYSWNKNIHTAYHAYLHH